MTRLLLIASAPPFLRLPAGSIFYEVLDARPPKVLGGVTRASEGDRVELHCPVFGYPQPYTRWEKDGEPLDRSLPIEYDGDTLILMSVDDTMSGIYTCIADNSFPLFDDGPSLPHELHYFQKFVVDR
ncbi:unnamed protein product [Heligmosomoides polygyrus]|uniref:Ig-like domain-containing protein n=1 Tax=Heligmosomoides polygyrus TaxID=6339 RepID=A0A183FNP8_HELPZ|nr:unnamed protein product [Heligmosomoides polygyrus]